MAEQDPSAPSPDGPTPENPAPENPANATRCGFAAMLGAPNAGKSTLVNRMTGTKVSIVSRKVQTTRTTVRGIALQGASQIILVDTPGVFAPRRRLDRAMVQRAWSGASDADVIVLGTHDRGWFSRLLTGSVSSDVLRHADVPVLVAR